MKRPGTELGEEHLDVAFPDEFTKAANYYYEQAHIAIDELALIHPNEEDMRICANRLTDICPYVGELVLCSGDGLVPVLDPQGKAIGEEYREGVEVSGYYGGAAVWVTVPPDSPPIYRVGHSIQVGVEETSPFVTVRDTREYFAFMDISSQILVMSDIVITPDAIFQPEEMVLRSLHDRSEQYKNLIRSTLFRRQSRRKQMRQVQEFVHEANHDIALTGAELRVCASYGYVPLLNDFSVKLVPIEIDDVMIEGQCMGLASLEVSLLEGKAVRRDRDVEDIESGLCLTIDPNESTISNLGTPAGKDRYPILIPLGSQTVELEVCE